MNEQINTTIKLTEDEAKQRVEKAVELFKQGYNCSQSVVAAFADLYGFTKEQALRMSASFGGGVGGMFLLAGLDCGATDGADRAGKSHNYAVVQQLADAFRHINGSIICAELLGLSKPNHDPQAEERTAAYYKKRPCAEMVRTGAQLFADYLLKQQ